MSNLRVTFGAKIKTYRRGLNFTQEKLAHEVGISVDFLSLIERGINAPSFETIEKLSAVLNVKVKDLFDNDDSKNKDE